MSISANRAIGVGIIGVPQRRAHAVSARSLRLPLTVRVVCAAHVVAGVEAQSLGSNVPVSEDEEGAEDWLGAEVEDSVEDGFRVGGDDIATLTETPGDWVKAPEEKCPGAAEEESLAHVGAEEVGVLAGFPEEDVADVEAVSYTHLTLPTKRIV